MRLVFFAVMVLLFSHSRAWGCYYSGSAMVYWTSCLNGQSDRYVTTTMCPELHSDPIVYCQHPAPTNWPPSPSMVCELSIPKAHLGFFLSCPNDNQDLPSPQVHIPPMCPAITNGSIINVDSQIVSEVIPLVGMPFSLVYSSDRVKGMKAWTKAKLMISRGDYTPASELNGFEVKTEIDGVTSTQFINPAAGLSIDFTKPALSADDSVNFTVTYKYANSCGPISNLLDVSPLPEPVCDVYEANLHYPVPVAYPKIVEYSFNGWTLSIQHFYDKARNLLMFGDGSIVETPSMPQTGNAHWVLSPDGEEIFVFDINGRHIETKDSLLGTSKFLFNYSSNQLISIVDAYNNQTTFQYSNGQLVSITSPYNQITQVDMDSLGNITSITNPASEVFEMTYYPEGLLHTFEDPSGIQSTMTYDSEGKLLSDISSTGRSTILNKTLNNNGFIVTETSALGRIRSHEVRTILKTYDRTTVASDYSRTYFKQISPSEVIVSDESGYSKTTKLQKDPRFEGKVNMPEIITVQAGNSTRVETYSKIATLANPTDPLSLTDMTTQLDLNGKVFSSFFTSSNKTTVTTSPVGRTTNEVLNSHGGVVLLQKGSLTPFGFTYDSRGRISTLSQGSRTTTFNYDSNGNLASVENPLMQTTSFAYNLAGRVTSQTLADQRVITYDYDSRGNLISVTPPGSLPHGLTYNGLGHISNYTPPLIPASGTLSTSYLYNNDDQLTSITRPGGGTVEFVYDPTYKNLTSIVLPGNKYRSLYYSKGYLSQAHSEDSISIYRSTTQGLTTSEQIIGGPLWHGISYSYNNQLLLASENFYGEQVYFGHDDDGLLSAAGDLVYTRTTTDGLITSDSLGVINQDYTHSNFGELSSIEAGATGNSLYSEIMIRDALGRISSRTEKYGTLASSSFDYTYDSAGRLTEVKLNNVTHSLYSYDSNSNRVSQTINGQSISGITYDAQDRLIQFGTNAFTYNLNGDLASKTDSQTSSTTSYVYDIFGNLKSVSLPSKTITYGVDAFNRRVSKSENGTAVNYFIWNKNNQLIALMNSVGQAQARFVYGEKSHVPEYMIQGTDKFRIITNHLGSPVLIVNSITGAVAQEIKYGEFGNILSDTSPGFTPFGFAGCLYDQDTKLCRFGARDYDPSIGRWVSKDPILFAGNDTNLYSYVFQDPINYIDTEGFSGKFIYTLEKYIAGGGGPRVSNGGTFYVSPNGTTVQAPPGSTVGPANNGAGLKIQFPNSSGGANTIRMMDPTPQYPGGYIRLQNSGGQYMDPAGNPLGRKDPKGHICE